MGIGVCRLSIFRTEPLNRYEKGSQLSGVIYIHRISDNRFGGITGRNFDVFRKLCGELALKNVVLVTNMWGEVSLDIGEAREFELSNNFFKTAVYKGAQMVRHHNTVESAHDIIRKMIKNRPVILQIQRELVDDHKDIIDTAAGESINKELKEQIKRHQAELKEVQEEMAQALREKDGEAEQELEETQRDLKEKVMKIKEDSVGMAANYAAEKERVAARLREMEQEARRERERSEPERQRQLTESARRVHGETAVPVADRDRGRPQTRPDSPSRNGQVAIPIYA